MKYISKILFLATAVLAFVACNRVEDLPFYDKGQAVQLQASATSVAPTPADSSKAVLTLSWTSPKYATDSANYKFLVEIDSAGRNFSKAVTREVMGKLSTSFTGKELNAILLNYDFAVGVATNLEARVISSYANNNERYTSNVVKFAATPYNQPSVLTSSTATVTGTLATASQNALTFSWTPSFVGYAGAVTYSLQYDSAGKNFANAKEIQAGASTFTRAMTIGEINTAALNSGVTGGSLGKVDFRVKAVTAAGAVSFSAPVAITVQTYQPLLRFYVPGGYQAATGNGSDWNPGSAPELIRDLRPGLLNNMYYAYMYFPAGAEFKITQGRGWDINYGGSNGNLERNGANFKINTEGVYRISFDLENMKYDIREGRMGFVGNTNSWNPGNTFPNFAMGSPADNLFVGIANFATGGWKMIDNNEWNNGSNSVTETRSYGSNGGSGSTLLVNGPNMPDISTAGRYRVMWDGRDRNNIRYEMSSASEMRVVGDGIKDVNAWDPGSSPQMDYKGNGKWEITLELVAGKDIKFLAGNAWGAFDYEDASGGSTSVGSPRKIQWDGGPNFKTPAASGTYTIILDEHNQTVTIQQ